MSRRYPFFQQLDSMDCGPTCLRMVAAWHGRHFSLQYLREQSHIDRDGVSMLGIVKAAEHIGFEATAYRLPFSTTDDQTGLEDLDAPFIVHWQQQHFVVVYAIRAGYVWVADPAQRSVQRISQRDFLTGWCPQGEPAGIVLLLLPTPAFFATEGMPQDTRTGLWHLLPYLRPYRRLMGQLVIGLVALSGLQLIFPFLTQAIVDVGIDGNDMGFIYLMLVGMLLVFAGEVTISLLQGWILLHVGTRINVSLVTHFLQKIMRLPLGYFDQKSTGDFLQRIADQRRIESFLTNTSLSVLFSLFSLVVLGGVLWWYDGLIFGIFVIAAVLYTGWIVLFLRRRAMIDQQRFRDMTANQNALIELIEGMPDIRLQQSEHKRRRGWVAIQNRLFRTQTQFLTLTQYQDTGAQVISQLKDIFIIFVAARAVLSGSLTLGGMLAIQYIIGQLNVPLRQLAGFVRTAQDARLSLERLSELYLLPDEAPAAEAHIEQLPTAADLHIRNLSFAYNPLAGNILHDVSFIIPHGRVTAIIGASGSGKTTLLKLLLGFYMPQSGGIYLGDFPLSAYAPSAWRHACGTVMQDGFIFSDTIANNIAEGAATIDTERLMAAIRTANLHTFVAGLPQHIHTLVGAQGNGLSQGQRQRLLIARAVYKNPDYLFFDEATNALDADNEQVIVNNLRHFYAGKTIVIVAHRLSTVRDADQIVVLEQGRWVEQGTHDSLLARRGRYYELVKNQLSV